MRIGGLGSGIDTDGIIEKLMTIERRPLVIMQSRQQELEAQKSAWRDINARLKRVSDKFSSLKLASTYVGRITKASNEGILKAQASPSVVEGSYQVNVKQLATAAVRYSEGRVADVDAALGSGTLTLKDADDEPIVELTIAENESLRDFAKRINELKLGEGDAATPLPIQASIVDNRLVLTSKETGAASKFAAQLTGTTLSEGFVEVVGSGVDAELEVNGIAITAGSNTLKDVIQGLTLDLMAEGKTTLTVSQDTQQVVDKLQEFVDQYNSLIDFVNDKLQAKSVMDPNSKRGTLSGDVTLMRLQSSLRSIVVDRGGGDGKYSSLADIGIGTAQFVAGAADYSGKLILDKAKLEEALKEDPLLNKIEGTGEEATESGVFHNLESYMREFTRAGDGILTEKDKMYDRMLKDLKDSAEKMEYRLKLRQEGLNAQFVALEKALASMKSQESWLTGQLGQINNLWSRPNK